MTLKENLTQVQSKKTVKSQYDQKYALTKTLLSSLLVLCSHPYQINSDNVTDSDITITHGSSKPCFKLSYILLLCLFFFKSYEVMYVLTEVLFKIDRSDNF